MIFVATSLFADEPERILGKALAEAELGHCAEALGHLDQYLAATKNPSNDAFEVLRRCPRANPPTPAPATHKPRGRWFLIDVELGVGVPLLAPEAQFVGAVELGIALSNRIGLDLVLLAESVVSRPRLGTDIAQRTVFSEDLELGVEERRVVWRKLAIFGTVAAGILVDTYNGFNDGVALHVDAGAAWMIGPGEVRLRPVDFAIFVVTDGSAGASWRATAGYALRF